MELNDIYCFSIKQEKNNRNLLLEGARGIEIVSLGVSQGDDITLTAETSINIIANEDVSNAIYINAANGGIDITSSGSTAGDDIDITSTASINIKSNENVADAIVISANYGGIDIQSHGTTPDDNIDIHS